MSACSRVPCEGYYPWPELIEPPNQHFPGYAPGRFDRFTLCYEAIVSTYENRFYSRPMGSFSMIGAPLVTSTLDRHSVTITKCRSRLRASIIA